MMMLRSLSSSIAWLAIAASTTYNVSAYHTPKIHTKSPTKLVTAPTPAKISSSFPTTAATMALSFLLLQGPSPAFASDRAAQISLDGIPPSSISIQIQDLPVIGSLISGTYTKVPDNSLKEKASVVIKSPKDKVGAIADIAKGGHLEFDINGKVNTHLDVDVAADEAGTLKVLVQSDLIPTLPFKNMASSSFGPKIEGGKESAWNIVTNLGTGESYYYNIKTGVTQYSRPIKI